MRITILLSFFIFVGCAKPDASKPRDLPNVVTADSGQVDLLIYGGPGIWKAEVESIKKILISHDETYEVLDQNTLNSFSTDDFMKYKAVLFVGGYAPTVIKALTPETHAHLRDAVQNRGLNYIGFCAGAWMAVAPAPEPGKDVVYGLGVVPGPLLGPSYMGKAGKEYALDEAVFPNGQKRKLLWYGGPITPEVPGGVIVRYSDGNPAISQIQSGKGLVVISGFHPAATGPILSSIGMTEAEAIDPEFAWQLLDAVIRDHPLPSF